MIVLVSGVKITILLTSGHLAKHPGINDTSSTMSTTLTSHLLALDAPAFTAPTQCPFLAAAGAGRVPKPILGKWLINDYFYIQAYITAASHALAAIRSPYTSTNSEPSTLETRLVHWILATLRELRREDQLFTNVMQRYDIKADIEMETSIVAGNVVRRLSASSKNAGLVLFERLFESLSTQPEPSADTETPPPPPPLPWLEAAVVFWGTEKVYLEAWTWAKGKQQTGSGEEDDADGGALRKELIPNWSNEEFRAFVEQLRVIVDDAVEETVKALGEEVRPGLLKRAEKVWRELVAAETAFWPDVE